MKWAQSEWCPLQDHFWGIYPISISVNLWELVLHPEESLRSTFKLCACVYAHGCACACDLEFHQKSEEGATFLKDGATDVCESLELGAEAFCKGSTLFRAESSHQPPWIKS